jgi:hypothetical protein
MKCSSFTELSYRGQECIDAHHWDRLEGDADAERALTADYVDKEEGAQDRRGELDHAEDGGGE